MVRDHKETDAIAWQACDNFWLPVDVKVPLPRSVGKQHPVCCGTAATSKPFPFELHHVFINIFSQCSTFFVELSLPFAHHFLHSITIPSGTCLITFKSSCQTILLSVKSRRKRLRPPLETLFSSKMSLSNDTSTQIADQVPKDTISDFLREVNANIKSTHPPTERLPEYTDTQSTLEEQALNGKKSCPLCHIPDRQELHYRIIQCVDCKRVIQWETIEEVTGNQSPSQSSYCLMYSRMTD